MAKYNVGVGDAFPLDEGPVRPRRDENGEARHGPCSHPFRRGVWAFQTSFILLAIWAVLEAFGSGGPNGLLIAAGIVFAIGLSQRLCAPRRRRHDHRRPFAREDR